MISEVKREMEISLPPVLAPGGCYFRDRSFSASEVDDNATRHPFAASSRDHIPSWIAIFRPWQKIEFGRNCRPRNRNMVHHGIHRRHSPVTARNGRKIDHRGSPWPVRSGCRLNIFHDEILLHGSLPGVDDSGRVHPDPAVHFELITTTGSSFSPIGRLGIQTEMITSRV